MSKHNRSAVTLFGPTASGKTGLGIALAQRFNGEIINADSRQIYQLMPIITAMPSAEEFAAAPHRLFNFLNPKQAYDVAQYVAAAKAQAEAVWQKGKLPIFVGGTGLYLQTLLEGMSQMPPVPEAVLAKLKLTLEEEGLSPLLDELKQADPAYYKNAGVAELSNPQRVVRALSVMRASGKPFSYWRSLPRQGGLQANTVVKIGLLPPRETLYNRITMRYDIMIEQGVLEEARSLFNSGYTEADAGISSIGLKEYFAHFNGVLTAEEAHKRTLQQMRNYAKRQTTWMRTQYTPDVLLSSAAEADTAIQAIASQL